MRSESRIGDLRAWDIGAGRVGTFLVVGVEGYRVDVILSDGKTDGFFKPYLESKSYTISCAIS
jgi:hypothetical protein